MKIITQSIVDEVCKEALNSERLRMNYNIHSDLDEKVHRLLNAFQRGTLLPIHRHLHPSKKETFVLLQGALKLCIYNDNKEIVASQILSRESGNLIADIEPHEWHSIEVLEDNTVILEIKEGPYLPFQEIDLLK